MRRRTFLKALASGTVAAALGVAPKQLEGPVAQDQVRPEAWPGAGFHWHNQYVHITSFQADGNKVLQTVYNNSSDLTLGRLVDRATALLEHS